MRVVGSLIRFVVRLIFFGLLVIGAWWLIMDVLWQLF